MKQSESPLDRLLKAAGEPYTAGEIPTEPPFGFTTRVIAGWKANTAEERTGLDLAWMRRALFCCLAVMAISVGWCLKSDTSAPADEMAIASFDTSTNLP